MISEKHYPYPEERFSPNPRNNYYIRDETGVCFHGIDGMLPLSFLNSTVGNSLDIEFFWFPITIEDEGITNWIIVESWYPSSSALIYFINVNVDKHDWDQYILNDDHTIYDQIENLLSREDCVKYDGSRGKLNLDEEFNYIQISTINYETVIRFLQAITFKNVAVNRNYVMKKYLESNDETECGSDLL